jgi:hypothetical protein
MNQSDRFRISNGPLVAVALLSLIFAYLSLLPLWHTDVWAHAKYGEWYWTHKSTPPVEPLSPYSDKETPFANVAWLSQVTYYGLYELGSAIAGGDAESRLHGGAEAIRSFHLLVLLGRFTFLWLALRRFGGSWAWASLGVVLYLMALRQEVAVQRPQSFGVFFLMVVLYVLSAPALSRRAMIALPLVFLVWANMHGTFVVGLAVMGLHGLGRLIERGPRDPDVHRLFVTGILCGLATLVNPHGPWLYKHVFAFSGHPNLKSMTEWFPMQVTSPEARPYLMSLVLLVFVWSLGKRKVGAAGWLVVLPFAAWPWFQVRALLWWWGIAVWLLARLGPGLADRFPNLPRFEEGEANWPRARTAIVLAAIAALFFPPIRGLLPGVPHDLDHTVAAGTPWRLALELKAEPADEGRWMPELRSAIRQYFPDGRYQGAIFSSETQGDFLIWALPADLPVMMFTHAHVFGPEYWEACRDAKSANPGWREFLARHRANLIVAESDSHEELAAELRKDPDWHVVHDGPESPQSDKAKVIVAVRKKPL